VIKLLKKYSNIVLGKSILHLILISIIFYFGVYVSAEPQLYLKQRSAHQGSRLTHFTEAKKNKLKNQTKSSKSNNCFITKTTTHTDGTNKTNTQSFYFETKQECQDLKNTLAINFSPRSIKKVGIKMDWRGK
jgi:hypothetical protein